ncbi:MAG: DUF6318 family protein [Dermabacter sp.]|nr:DUF6318 family protein [Dermabacter sp.]
MDNQQFTAGHLLNRGSWARRLAAAVAIATLGLTACSKEEEPEKSEIQIAQEKKFGPSGQPSDNGGADAGNGDEGTEAVGFAIPPQNKGMASPDPVNYPGMDSESDEGAEQAMRFFIDARYYGYATGDTAPLESVSHKNCKPCLEAVDDIRSRTREQGAFLTSYSIEPQEVVDYVPTRPGVRTIYYAYREGESERLFSDGSTSTYSGGNMNAVADLKVVDGRWQVLYAEWGSNTDV